MPGRPRRLSDSRVIAYAAVAAALLLSTATALGADAWPMNAHDAARTSRSVVVSAQAPVVLPGWPVMSDFSGPSVSPNGRVELALTGMRVATLNRNGTFGRIAPGGDAIGSDGRRYAIDVRGRVSAFTPAGVRLWRSAAVDLGSPVALRPAPPTTGAGVHAVGPTGVVAIAASGQVLWRLRGIRGDTPGGFAVGPDGKAYISFGSFVEPNRLVAVRPDGSTAWSRTLAGAPRDVAVSGDGTVLVGERAAGAAGATTLRAFASDGADRWTAPAAGNPGAIAADGTVYATSDRALTAVAPDGTVRWTFRGTGIAAGGVIVGGDGTLYVGGTAPQGLVALRPVDGSLAWGFAPGGAIFPTAIGTDGTLYAGCTRPTCLGNYGPTGRLFALAGASAPRLLYGLRLSSRRFRASGPPSLCVQQRGCRPREPLGSTLSFVSTQPGIVSIVIRRTSDGRVVGRTFGDSTGATVRVQRGTRHYALLDAVAWGPRLKPGHYTVAVSARSARPAPLSFTIVP
jgi:outer membrane protein assembly factor BamB